MHFDLYNKEKNPKKSPIEANVYKYVYMADHAGGRRSVVKPDTKVWRPFYGRPKKIILIKMRGIIWNKSCWKWFKLLFGFIPDEFIFVCFTKTKTGAKTAPRAPKLSYFDSSIWKYKSLVLIHALFYFSFDLVIIISVRVLSIKSVLLF